MENKLGIIELPEVVPIDPVARLNEVVDRSWKIFVSQFLGGRYPVATEAPFQHHFANIISTTGNLYCIGRDDLFLVDLETKCSNIKGKNKYLDITCRFQNLGVSCAIEVKFKTAKQGAQDHGRIDAYVDIEALEYACKAGYTFGKFYMITDSPYYVKPSAKGVGTVFAIHHGHCTEPGKEIWYNSKGREHVRVRLNAPYRFEWYQSHKWHFLSLHVAPKSSDK